MVVFFICLIILFFLWLLFFILCLSSLEIEISRLWFNSDNKKDERLEDYLLYLRIKLFNRITLLKFKIDDKKMDKIKESDIIKTKVLKKFSEYKDINSILLKNKKQILRNLKDLKQLLKLLNIKIKKLDLYTQISFEDAFITSFVVAFISSIISILLAINIDKYSKEKYKYIITPSYKNSSSVKIKLNCIINVKVVHIINVIYMLFIKKRSVNNDERTSNRRTYVCSNE